jgi:hypothetical protein
MLLTPHGNISLADSIDGKIFLNIIISSHSLQSIIKQQRARLKNVSTFFIGKFKTDEIDACHTICGFIFGCANCWNDCFESFYVCTRFSVHLQGGNH